MNCSLLITTRNYQETMTSKLVWMNWYSFVPPNVNFVEMNRTTKVSMWMRKKQSNCQGGWRIILTEALRVQYPFKICVCGYWFSMRLFKFSADSIWFREIIQKKHWRSKKHSHQNDSGVVRHRPRYQFQNLPYKVLCPSSIVTRW